MFDDRTLVTLYPSRKIDWDNIFLGMAYLMATGSHCSARKNAAILVKDGAIIATGVNGTPEKSINCDQLFPPKTLMTKEQKAAHKEFQSYTEIHAEMNAIDRGATSSANISGATLYCSCKPCHDCIKNILQAKIVRIVYYNRQNTPNGGTTVKNNSDSYHPLIEKTIKDRDIEVIQKSIDWETFQLCQEKTK